jgi:hypothetical protein
MKTLIFLDLHVLGLVATIAARHELARSARRLVNKRVCD